MASQNIIKRSLAVIPYVAGGFATLDLPRAYDYGTIGIKISGTINITTVATAVRAEAPCQLVQRVEIVADGKNTLYSAPYWFGAVGNVKRNSVAQSAFGLVAPSSTAVASYGINAISWVDFASIGAIRPKDSNYRSSGLSLFQLRLTFGQPGDVLVGGAATATNIVVEIFSVETIEIPDAKGAVSTPVCMKKVSYQEVALLATNANQEVRLPAGNQIAQVLLRTEGAVTAGEPTWTILNNAILSSGVDVRINMKGEQIRYLNSGDYGRVPTGIYVLDFLSTGTSPEYLTNVWDVSGQGEPKVVLDVAGAASNKVQAVITEYIFPNGASA